MSAYLPVVSMQKLFALMVAVSVLFAPAFASASQATPAMPDHHAQMKMKRHCESAPDDDQNKRAGKSCCFQMCMAVAAEPVKPFVPQVLLSGAAPSALQSFPVGTPAELATPPPRTA